MVERANGRMTVPQIFIGDDPCRRQRRPARAGTRRQARPAADTERRTSRHDRRHASPSASCRCARASTRARNLDAAVKLIEEAKANGADYVQTPEMTNIVANKRDMMLAATAPEENDPSLAAFRDAGAQARHPSAHRLARDQDFAGARRQPLVPDRPAGRDRRALRQDPHVRRRPRGRRELPRVAQLPAGRAGRGRRPAVGPARPDDLLRPALSRRCTGRWPRPARRSSRSRRPSPSRPARRTGTC